MFEPNVVKNWMRLRSTLEYIGLWECLNNSSSKRVEFGPPISRKWKEDNILKTKTESCQHPFLSYMVKRYLIFGQ